MQTKENESIVIQVFTYTKQFQN